MDECKPLFYGFIPAAERRGAFDALAHMPSAGDSDDGKATQTQLSIEQFPSAVALLMSATSNAVGRCRLTR